MFNKFTTAGISHPAQGSAAFDGASDYIQLDTPFSHTNHTIAAWVYANDDNNNKVIFDNRDANDDGIRFMILNDETAYYSLNANDLQYITPIADEWFYFVGTYDGSTQKIYINGS